ncbi:MAG: hypothetical protein II917_02080 [Synergistaceae bacterium]|nr:hypothetical protein [Synergistaceae bacterium]
MKRFFTFFVCFILLMSASVSWADITTWGDLKTALSNGGTVTLTQDITASNTDTAIEVTKTATLDLNGYTLNANGRYFSVITVNIFRIYFVITKSFYHLNILHFYQAPKNFGA